MNVSTFFNRVTKFLRRLYAFVPTKLPVGTQDFNSWASSILTLYGFPDNDSTRGGLAIMVTQLKPQDAYKSKRYFGLSIHVACAKEIAGNFYHEKKMEYKAKAEKEAAAKKQAEATASQAGSDNVVPIQS